MSINKDGIRIGSVTGGNVSFGGVGFIAPISVSQSNVGPGGGNTGSIVITIVK